MVHIVPYDIDKAHTAQAKDNHQKGKEQYHDLFAALGYERMESKAGVDATKADGQKGGYFVQESKE